MSQFSTKEVMEAVETAFCTEDMEAISEVCVSADFCVSDLDEGDLNHNVKIYLVDDSNSNKQGVHLGCIEDAIELGFRLADALETCFKDGFNTIYIHQKGA